MKLHINPFNRGNPMTLRDAAVVATIAAFVTWILTFFVNASMGTIREDPAAFCFEAVKAYLVSWAGTFATLAGLEELIKRKGTD